MNNRSENINYFESIMDLVERKGKDELMVYIRNSDFYTAPASTRFHLSTEGGLLQHSLNVYECLMAKRDNVVWGPILDEVGKDSLTIAFVKPISMPQNLDGEKIAIIAGNSIQYMPLMTSCHMATGKNL